MRQRRLVVDVLAPSSICCCTAVSAHCNPAETAVVGQRVYFDRVGGFFLTLDWLWHHSALWHGCVLGHHAIPTFCILTSFYTFATVGGWWVSLSGSFALKPPPLRCGWNHIGIGSIFHLSIKRAIARLPLSSLHSQSECCDWLDWRFPW